MIERKYYRINNNTLSVLECGNTENPVIVFLHGIPASAELWRETIIKLSSKGYYCLAPDLSGYGETEINSNEYYNLTKFSELLISFFEQKQLRDIKLVGHDIGGGIAQILITKKENLFDKVILSNCITAKSWPISNVEKMIKASKIGLFYWLAILGKFHSKKLFESLSKSFYRNKLTENDFNRIFYDGKFNKGKQVKKFQKMLKVLDNVHTSRNMELLSKTKLSVDLIWAMNDKFQPWSESGIKLESVFNNCRVFKINNCGHFLQIDAFEEYTELLLERLS